MEDKYQEALERAKPYYPDNLFLDTIFPELRESEDERIRKDIINLIYWLKANLRLCSQYYRDRYDGILAWLEKQKEQKPINWTELTWKDIVELEGIINNVHYDFSAGIGQESFGKEVLERFRRKKDEAEVDTCEQKPAEWSEEEAKKAAEDYADEFPGMMHENDGSTIEDYDKPYNDFLAGVLWAKHRGIFQNGSTHWKPTEEQMEALRVTLEYMPDTFKPRCTLMTLQNDLEKLM